MQHDPVSAPSHYTVYPVQPIAITRHLGFCLGNAVKYVLRAPHKGGAEDLRKALQYLEWEKDLPSPPVSVLVYRLLESVIGMLLAHLMDSENSYSRFQSDFLEYLSAYCELGREDLMKEMQDIVSAMLAEMEASL